MRPPPPAQSRSGTRSIRRPGASWRSTRSAAPERRHASSGGRTIRSMISWWGWTMPICAICGGCWAGIRRASCPCCWTTPGVRGRRSPIPGILGTLRRPTGTSWRGVRDCWIRSREHTIYKNDREPGPAARASSVVKQRIKSGELHKIRC